MKLRGGVTLLELLVAMVLVTIVSYFAYDLLKDENQNYVRTREKIKLQGDARDAMRIMEAEIRNTGFAVSADAYGPANLNTRPERCSEVWFDPTSGTSLAPTNTNASIAVGDQIVFRSYRTGSGAFVTNCADGFQEIGYRLSNGSLERYFRSKTSDPILWVPFLNDVVSFQVQYGVAGVPNATIGDKATILDPTRWTPGPNVVACGTRCLTMTGWTTSSKLWSTNMTGINVKKGERYRIQFSLEGDFLSGMLASETTGPSAKGYDRKALFAGLMSGTTFLDSSLVWAGDSSRSPANVELFLTMPNNASNVKFAVRGKLNNNALVGTQSMTIRNLEIDQVGAGTFTDWLSAPTNPQLGKVKAVRLTLLAKTQDKNKEGVKAAFSGEELGDNLLPSYVASGADTLRSHVLIQRVIPVVNNGN